MTPQSGPASAGTKKKVVKYPPVTSYTENELPSKSRMMTSPTEFPGLVRVSIASPSTPHPSSALSFPSLIPHTKSQVGSPRPPSLQRPDGPLLLRHRMRSELYRVNKKTRARQLSLATAAKSNGMRQDDATIKALRDVSKTTQESPRLRPRSHQVMTS